MKKIDITVNAKNELYSKSNKFAYEKKHAEARLLYENVISGFLFQKGFKNEVEMYEDYKNSYLYRLKKQFANGSFLKFSHLIKKETLDVNFEIKFSKKDKVKKKIVNSQVFSDYLVDFLYSYRRLSAYLKVLDDYKKEKDEGKKEFFILSYGSEYSSNEEFRNIRMLVENTQGATLLLEKDNYSLEKVKFWLDFLEENIGITTTYMEYGIVVSEPSRMPVFSKVILDDIYAYSKILEKELASLKVQNSAKR